MDLYRSCPECNYDLCLQCCQDLREGKLLGCNSVKESTEVQVSELPLWKANEDGSIPCPPEGRGGCWWQETVLRQIGKHGWINKLVTEVESAVGDEVYTRPQSSEPCQLCSAEKLDSTNHTKCVRQAAQRNDSVDNFIYCPSSLDMGKNAFEHFQKHWLKGEPVIVRDVLEKTKGLSWEPMVMCNAFRETAKNKFAEETNSVKAIDCLDWCEVKYTFVHFIHSHCLTGTELASFCCMSDVLSHDTCGFPEYM